MVTGINATIVTFRTTPELVSAIIRGDVDVGFDYYAAFNPMVTAKQIKVIAMSGDEPTPRFRRADRQIERLSRLRRQQLEFAVGPGRHS